MLIGHRRQKVSSTLIGCLMCFAFHSTIRAEGWEPAADSIRDFEERHSGYNATESRVSIQSLPDPLRPASRERAIAGVADWEKRRSELLAQFATQVYGAMPPAPTNVRFEVIETDPVALGGTAIMKRIQVTADLADASFSFPFVLFTPHGEPRPVFVHINIRNRVLNDPHRTTFDEFWPVDRIIARGYATAAVHKDDLAPDNAETFRDGILALTLGAGPREPSATGALAAWAWGASRVLDALKQEGSVDVSKVAVIGHSRGGKAALVAGATDERFGLTISNNSGCGGAALSRRNFGETVEAITNRFGYWFCPRFASYVGHEGSLPVDQHELIACIAPRGVYVASADQDLWADPRGEWLSLIHAGPVYQLLGEDALQPSTAMPNLDEPIMRGRTAYHIRTGKHNMGEYDWQRYMDYADQLW